MDRVDFVLGGRGWFVVVAVDGGDIAVIIIISLLLDILHVNIVIIN